MINYSCILAVFLPFTAYKISDMFSKWHVKCSHLFDILYTQNCTSIGVAIAIAGTVLIFYTSCTIANIHRMHFKLVTLR